MHGCKCSLLYEKLGNYYHRSSRHCASGWRSWPTKLCSPAAQVQLNVLRNAAVPPRANVECTAQSHGEVTGEHTYRKPLLPLPPLLPTLLPPPPLLPPLLLLPQHLTRIILDASHGSSATSKRWPLIDDERKEEEYEALVQGVGEVGAAVCPVGIFATSTSLLLIAARVRRSRAQVPRRTRSRRCCSSGTTCGSAGRQRPRHVLHCGCPICAS